jgi:PAS domain S-box-containing protein
VNRVSLKYRIALTIFVLEAVMVTLVLWKTQTAAFDTIKSTIYEEERVFMNVLGDLSRKALITSEYGDLQTYFDEIINDPHFEQIVLSDFRGRVVASTDTWLLGQESPQLEENGSGIWRTSRLVTAAGDLGALSIKFSNTYLVEAHQKSLVMGITIAAVSMAVIAVVGLLIGHVLVWRLDRLTRAAQQLSKGDLGIRARISGSDEVARLSNAFNAMAQKIESGMNALRQSESRSRAIIAALPDVMFHVDRDGRYLEYIPSRDGGPATTAEEFLGKTINEIMPKDIAERQMAMINKALAANETQIVEFDIPMADGPRYFEARFSASGQDTVLAVARDITDRRRAEKGLKTSLREKEVLLEEVHHRVKNNMAIISSLLNLQSRHVGDEGVKRMFMDCQNRINSMALVHEKLYQSRDFANIDFRDYVRSLLETISDSYGLAGDIALRIDADDLRMDMNTLIPCGLIVNELVTNSFKHAFGGVNDPEIRIGLGLEGSGRVVLTIGDNGRSLPVDMDYRDTGTLGLQIVNALVGQLKGGMELDRSGGTNFRISFELPGQGI